MMKTLARPAHTFRIARPKQTHFWPATCEEVECPHHLKGWVTVVPTAGPQADYIRHHSERRFEEVAKAGGLAEFRFYPGQRCFRQHWLPNNQTPLWLHLRDGHEPQRYREFNEFADNMNETFGKYNRRMT